MKGILMFDNLNDLAFFNADSELTQHIKNLAMKDGLLEDLSFRSNTDVVDRNIVMQLFSPLIASYKVMQVQFGNRYKSIESEYGVLLVFDEILNHIVIGVTNTEENNEAHQEIAFFLVLVKMLYGLSLNMMKNEISSCTNNSRSELLSQMLDKWRSLKSEQQMFLVEAVERLLINQDITAMCVNLLQEVLEKIRSIKRNGSYCHSFALVDTKLIALYSSRNAGQLPKETLLLLILVVQVLRSSFVSLEQIVQQEQQKADEQFFVPVPSSSKLENSRGEKKNERSNKSSSTKENDIGEKKFKTGAQSLLVYLKSKSGPFVPYMLYLVEVTNRINVVLLCEMTVQGTISSAILSLTEVLYNIQCHPASRTQVCSFDHLETSLRTVIDVIWKSKIYDDKEKLMKKIVTKWEQVKQCEIEKFLQDSKEKSIDPRLDSAVSSFCEVLRSVFEEMIALPLLKYEKDSWNAENQELMKSIQKVSHKRMKDIADYLEVKALQNITMTSYMAEYPGLIHFIYVDRSTNCVIAPAVVLKKGHLNGATSLKNKIWKMVNFGRSYIDGAKNYCCLWKDEDLCYLYTIWFEDSTGRIIKPSAYPNLKKFPFRGILCGNFFSTLVQKCFPNASYEHIFCYELFCVHLDSTSTDQIVNHFHRLCSQLWDFSGAYRASLDLL